MKYTDETPSLEVSGYKIFIQLLPLRYICSLSPPLHLHYFLIHAFLLHFPALLYRYLSHPFPLSLSPFISITQAKIELIKTLKDICEGKMYVEGESAQLHLTLANIMEEGKHVRTCREYNV